MKVTASKTSLLGACGEHFVMGELLRRDMIAALAPQGVPNMDIVVTDVLGNTLSAIQVKTRRAKGADGGWHMRPKHETLVSPHLFYVFVDLGVEAAEEAKYWIIPSDKVAKVIYQSHRAWLARPGKNGHVRKDSSVRRLLPDYTKAFLPDLCPYPMGWLDEYSESWHRLASR